MRSLLLIAAFIITLTTSCGKVVPPGTVVIVLSADGSTNIHREGVYTDWGRDKVYFVDGKLKSFSESLRVLCKDDVNIDVDIKWIGSFAVDKKNMKTIKEKVPAKKVDDGYGLNLSAFYKTAMKDIIRSKARDVISKYETDAVPKNRDSITKAIRKGITTELSRLNYPVETSNILVSNIDYPEEVTAQRLKIKNMELSDTLKAAEAKANLAQAGRDEELAMARGKATVVRAKAEAKANLILTKSLTPEIIAFRQWEALEKIGAGKNNELIVIPYNAINGSTMSNMINRRSIRSIKQ